MGDEKGQVFDIYRKKLQIYRSKLIPRHPAIFSEWFLRKFPDPTSWYTQQVTLFLRKSHCF